MADEEKGIGYGVLKPYRREAADFAAGTGQPLLASAVRSVINTRAAGFGGKISGEYPWRKNFGSWIHLLRHTARREYGNDLAVIYASMALDRWEPRVVAQPERSETIPQGDDDSTEKVRIYYRPADETGANTETTPYDDTYQEAVL